MKFNINDHVKVKLTDRGREILKQNWKEIFSAEEYRQPQTDEDGWSKFQLWSLFQEFGEHIYLGCEMPFKTEIQLVTGEEDVS